MPSLFAAVVAASLGAASLAGTSGAATTTPAVAAAYVATVESTWGNAKEVPHSASLNSGGYAVISSVSCASAGNCSAGGSYTGGSGHSQAFVVNEKNGTWGNAKEVPHSASLNTGGSARIYSVSCPSAGDCSAGGYYTGGSSHLEAFVVNEKNGTWGNVEEVPHSASLNAGGYAEISSVSCASAGNCSAGGSYTGGSSHRQVFVVNEKNGTWGNAKEVPHTASLNTGGYGYINSVACASAGNCSAGGSYTDGSAHLQALVVNKKNGTWGNAKEVPHSASLNTGGSAYINSVACASAGNCSAGGSYTDGSGHFQAFVVNEKNDTWGNAKEVPHSASLNAGGHARIYSVACASAGNCSAGGYYTASLNAGGYALISSVSCASAGNCSAGGWYTGGSGHHQAFVVNEKNGTWGNAKEVPHTASLNTGGSAAISSVSCASAGNCSAGGSYEDGSGHFQAFVVNYAPRPAH
jgi:cytochrome c551/c552